MSLKSISETKEILAAHFIDDISTTNSPQDTPIINPPPTITPPSPNCLTQKSFVILLSFITGLYSLSSLASFMYQKQILNLSPSTIQFLSGLLAIPWGLKFIFGYSYDILLSKIHKSKYLVITLSIIRIFICLIIYYYNISTFVFVILAIIACLCGLYENIVSECMLVVMTKNDNLSNPNEKANHLPIFFGFRALGQLVGSFFGGRIITHISVRAAFLFTAFLPLIMIAVCIFYHENPVISLVPVKSFAREFESIKSLILRDKVIQMLIFVSLINMTPNFDAITTFYQTDYLKFTSDDLANFQTFSTFCYILGLIFYSTSLRKFDPHKFYIFTNFLLWLINVSFMLVVTDYITEWGWSTRLFCLFNSGFYSFVTELNFMPIIAIWCSICPSNLEATSITLLTAFINMSGNCGVYFGGIIMIISKIEDDRFDKLWVLLLIQNLYLIVAIVVVLFVRFPDPSKVPLDLEMVALTDKNYEIDFYFKEDK